MATFARAPYWPKSSSWDLLHFAPHLLSLLSLSCWQVALSWCCLFFYFSSFSFCFFFYPDMFLFFLYPEASGLGFCWPACNLRLFISLFEPCVLLVFRVHTSLPWTLRWLSLILSHSRIFKFIVAPVERGFWLLSCQLLKFNCTFQSHVYFIT